MPFTLDIYPRLSLADYVRGWFFVDLLSCLPYTYVSYIVDANDPPTAVSELVEDSESSQNFRATKTLRLIRLTKMLRIARIKRMISRFGESVFLSRYLYGFGLLAVILFLLHLLSCVWYWSSGDMYTENGEFVHGWVKIMEMSGQWNASTKELSTRYTTSLYFAFNSLEHAESDREKVAAILCELTLAVIYGMLAGLMSSIMMAGQADSQDKQRKMARIRGWLVSRRVPADFQSTVMSYFHKALDKKNANSEGFEKMVLDTMPPAMASKTAAMLYGDWLSNLPLFKGLSQEIITSLCKVVVPLLVHRGQQVIKEQDLGTEMYMLLRGEVEVTKEQSEHFVDEKGKVFTKVEHLRLGFLGEGAFFGEAGVLAETVGSGAEIRTRTVTAVVDSEFCYLTREALMDVRNKFVELDGRIRRFSTVGQKLNKKRLTRAGVDFGMLRDLKQHTNSRLQYQADGAIMKSPMPGGIRKGHRLTKYALAHIESWSFEAPESDDDARGSPKPHPPLPLPGCPTNRMPVPCLCLFARRRAGLFALSFLGSDTYCDIYCRLLSQLQLTSRQFLPAWPCIAPTCVLMCAPPCRLAVLAETCWWHERPEPDGRPASSGPVDHG